MDSGLESLPADSPLPLLTSSIVTAPLLKLPPRVLPSLGKLCRLVDQVVTCFFSIFYLLTVIFTTGSPLKLPPSVLECLLSIPPTPPIDLVHCFDIKAHSVIWLIDLMEKHSAKLPLV